MRLYRLISRTGYRKRRTTPWFKAAAAGPPVRYAGWIWDPANREWLPEEMRPVTVTIEPELYPMPTQLPSRVYSAQQPGWSYSFTTHEWVPTIVMATAITAEPIRSLPPDVTMDDVYQAAVYDVNIRNVLESLKLGAVPPEGFTRVHIDNLIRMLEKSGYTRAAADKVMAQYVKLTAGVDPATKARIWKAATKSIFECWQRSHKVGTATAQHYWADYVKNSLGETSKSLGPTAAAAVWVLVAAVAGFLLGRLMDLVLTPKEELFVLHEEARTYLIGPEFWKYSRMISRTPAGTPYYSMCEEIGTTWVRLRRGTGAGDVDIIDFPGGFVESGYDFPYFVKYTWSYWTLSYVGMLSHQGTNVYSLRRGDRDRGGLRPGSMIPAEEWCSGFHWYL